MEKLKNFLGLQEIGSEPNWEALVAWLVSLLVCFGFLYGESEFAKLGIPISALQHLGAIENFSPKLFIGELFCIFSFVLFISYSIRKHNFCPQVTAIEWLCFAILTWACVVWLLTWPSNIILAYRNSAFCWYLVVPSILSRLPIESKHWEKLFAILGILCGVWVCGGYLLRLMNPDWGSGFLFVQIGFAPILGFGLLTKNRLWAYICMLLVGSTFGQLLVTQTQRTTLLGSLLALLIVLVFGFKKWKQYIARVAMLLFFGYAVAITEPYWHVKPSAITEFEKQKTQQTKQSLDQVNGPIYQYWHQFKNRQIKRANQKWINDRSNTESQKSADQQPAILDSNALRKKIGGSMEKAAELNNQGLEKFRLSMWADAFRLFLQHPFIGIGFEKQVVYRIRLCLDENGNDYFIPNDGTWSPFPPWSGEPPPPPISGPHNSYINALARLGIPAILLVALHALSALVLWKKQLYFCFFVLLGQTVYSMFNVGLEGPARGFVILFTITAALRVQRERLARPV